ncbi:hypothetical protein VF04_00405 [Nostoc linckia z7]|uniref:Uncharacterized protein n=2 Tax=Nostoc linckia TaxID=92942 RepID=A0A9Q5ZGS4_NOSLI|nr:hypothetical protein [Nostoc linckia]PHK46780.1 hypothetical protein VF13_08820 [Nostoc linckia z16]PHJ73260.1 hypothetical protein VF05_01420 [Nostoc linckia z3]PHJ78607.1 hypothetical protein VF03_00405 [Nostoc linckia z2]PHJ85711.1 hypothetical protein VF06_05725 [Nostoc linckia z4]PHJ92213.1 hypothetical protein VF07_01710 [Nostoc linckia z6]
MEFNRRRPRTSNDKLNAPEAFLRVVNATTEQQFHRLLKNLVSAVSKDSSNNVAIVAIAAMFFGFAVPVLRPATTVVQPQINLQSNPTTTVTTQQEQIQRINRGSDTGS